MHPMVSCVLLNDVNIERKHVLQWYNWFNSPPYYEASLFIACRAQILLVDIYLTLIKDNFLINEQTACLPIKEACVVNHWV